MYHSLSSDYAGYACDVKGELKQFAVFTSDVRVAPLVLSKARIALRTSSGARTQTRNGHGSGVVWFETYLAHAGTFTSPMRMRARAGVALGARAGYT